ncbi:MAG: class I SAM-dependent methyltransferase [Planctomycetota bacterium]
MAGAHSATLPQGSTAERAARAACRSCGHLGLAPVLDLGLMPHSDGLLADAAQIPSEPRWPLELAFCPGCTLVQILETVPPEVLFGADYPYFSSFSESWVAHARACVQELIARKGLGPNSLAVELASNDGYLLRHFKDAGVPVLGIDPAPGPAAAAEKIGVPTRVAFFGLELARTLRAEGKAADVLVGNNVLAHVADTNGFVRGIATLLHDGGLVSLEFPYLRDLIEKCAFDTIYHEHLCYFSMHAVDALLRRHGLFVNEVRRLKTHGGSLRLYVEKVARARPTVEAMLAEEKASGMDQVAYYREFSARVRELGDRMRELLAGLRAQGKRIVAYGAAAKGTIMLNWVNAPAGTFEYAVDRNVHKQGRLMPGVHLPIKDPSVLAQDRPDYLVILPWNLTDEIVAQQSAFRQAGGKFVVPVPEPKVIG